MKLTVQYDDNSQEVLSSVTYWQVKHDYELQDHDMPIRDSLPEVFRLAPQHYVNMTEEIQWFMFDLLSDEMDKVSATQEQKKAAWRYLYKGTSPGRAFTNGRGVDTCWDYITPANIGAPLPGLSTLICGGNIVRGTVTMAKWDKTLEPCLLVDTVDRRALPYYRKREEAPWLTFYATIATRLTLPDGTMRVTRFSAPPMMGADAPVPLMSNEPVVIPLWMLKKRNPQNPLPSPYNY